MKTTTRYGLLIGAVAIAGVGVAGAGMQKPAQKPHASYQASGMGTAEPDSASFRNTISITTAR